MAPPTITKGVPLPVLAGVALPIASSAAPVFLPDASGIPMPQGCTTWEMQIDQAAVPQGEPYELTIEYLYAAGWHADVGAMLAGGTFTPRSGLPTSTNFVRSFIGPGVVSGFVPEYPTAVRVRIGQSQGRVVSLRFLTDGVVPRSLLPSHHSTAHVQTKDAQTASGTALNVSLTSVGAGNHLVASSALGGTNVATADNHAPTSTPTATWSVGVAAVQEPGNSANLRMDYSENVASGSWTVTQNSSPARELTCCVAESSGVATTSSKGQTNSHPQASGTTLQPGSITPAAGSILFTATADAGGSTSADTIDSSFVVSSDATAWNGSNQRAGIAHKDNVAASAVNPTWTLPTSVGSVAMVIEFLAAASTQEPVFGMRQPMQGLAGLAEPVIGSPLDRVMRLARDGWGFLWQSSPVKNIGTDLPAYGRSWPDTMVRPRNEGFTLAAPVLNIGTDRPAYGQIWPDTVAMGARPPGFVAGSPTWLIGQDRPAFGATWPDTLKLPKPPVFDHQNEAAFLPTTIQTPVPPGSYPATLPRPSIPGFVASSAVWLIGTDRPATGWTWPDTLPRPRWSDFVASSPIWLIGTDRPAFGLYMPDTVQLPKAPVFDHQNESVFLPVTVQSPVPPGVYPATLPRPSIPGFVVPSPTWLIGSDQPAFGRTWPDTMPRPRLTDFVASSPVQPIGTDRPPFGRTWPQVLPWPRRPWFDHQNWNPRLPVGALRDLVYRLGQPGSAWTIGKPFSTWATKLVNGVWRVGPPQE